MSLFFLLRTELVKQECMIDLKTIATNSSLFLNWKLPNYMLDSIELNYKIEENNSIYKEFLLNKTSNSFLLNELTPGSTVLLNLTLISENKSSSCVTSKRTLLGQVLVENIRTTSDTIELKINNSFGYYQFILMSWFCEMQTTSEDVISLPFKVDTMSFKHLLSGCEYSVKLTTIKTNFEPVRADLKVKTLLTPIQFTIIESSSGILKFNWDTSYYDHLMSDQPIDYLEISITFLRADNISNANVSDCLLYSTVNITDIFKSEYKVNNVCYLTNYDITLKAFRNGFEPVESGRSIKTNYGNINCSLIQVQLIEEKVALKWPKTNILLNYSSIYIFETTNNSNLQAFNVTDNQSSIEVSNLNSNLEYEVQISTRYNNFKSKNCSKKFFVPQCSPLREDLLRLNETPYIDKIEIKFNEKKTLVKTNDFNYMLVTVGKEVDCYYQNSSNCFIVLNTTYKSYLEHNKTLSLPNRVDFENKTLRIEYDFDYYVLVSLIGPCGVMKSKSLKFNIPSVVDVKIAVMFLATFSVVLLVTVMTRLAFLNYKETENFFLNDNK